MPLFSLYSKVGGSFSTSVAADTREEEKKYLCSEMLKGRDLFLGRPFAIQPLTVPTLF